MKKFLMKYFGTFISNKSFDNYIKFLGSLLLIIFIFLTDIRSNKNDGIISILIREYIDRSVLFSIFAIAILNIIITFSLRKIRSIFEEPTKLYTNLEEIQEYFPRIYSQENLINYKINEESLILPGIILFEKNHNNPLKINILDKKTMFKPQPYISLHQDELLAAHNFSYITNNVVVRVDDFKIDYSDFSIALVTSRSTFFNSLITNRALDKKIEGEYSTTIRELYEPGPVITPLSESFLSNHLGFNIFIITQDNFLILVKRSANVSVSKNTLGPSIAASLKSKYALNNENQLTLNGINNAIINEGKDELKLESDIDNFTLENNLYYVYRDLIEGGKPQLVGYYNIEKTFHEVKNNFNKNIGKNKTKAADGKLLIGIPLEKIEYFLFKLLNNEKIVSKELNLKNESMSPQHLTALYIMLKKIE